MSNNDNSPSIIGASIEILRQRFFIDHSSKAKTFVTEEYTIIAKDDDVGNIWLEVPHFLPNLKIYDADGEELALVPNEYTFDLLNSAIDKSEGELKKQLLDLKKDLTDFPKGSTSHKKYLLWIKLPDLKKLKKNELKVINLEYDSEKELKPSKHFTIDFVYASKHNVFYTIRKPEDYEFKTKDIEIFDEKDGLFKFTGWTDKKNTLIYVNEGFDSLTITIKSEVVKPIKMKYSFRPNKKIISFPLGAIVILSILPLFLLGLKICNCHSSLSQDLLDLELHKVEIGAGIIGGALIIPGLIHNQFIRDSLKFLFFIPIFITFLVLF